MKEIIISVEIRLQDFKHQSHWLVLRYFFFQIYSILSSKAFIQGKIKETSTRDKHFQAKENSFQEKAS